MSTYSGISFPPRRTSAGFFALATDEDLVRQSIHVILNTSKGSMPMVPEFGCSAHSLLFESINNLTQNVIAQKIKEDIERWEPRVSVISIDGYSYENTRYFKMVLQMKNTGNSFELTTDFSKS